MPFQTSEVLLNTLLSRSIAPANTPEERLAPTSNLHREHLNTMPHTYAEAVRRPSRAQNAPEAPSPPTSANNATSASAPAPRRPQRLEVDPKIWAMIENARPPPPRSNLDNPRIVVLSSAEIELIPRRRIQKQWAERDLKIRAMIENAHPPPPRSSRDNPRINELGSGEIELIPRRRIQKPWAERQVRQDAQRAEQMLRRERLRREREEEARLEWPEEEEGERWVREQREQREEERRVQNRREEDRRVEEQWQRLQDQFGDEEGVLWFDLRPHWFAPAPYGLYWVLTTPWGTVYTEACHQCRRCLREREIGPPPSYEEAVGEVVDVDATGGERGEAPVQEMSEEAWALWEAEREVASRARREAERKGAC